MAKRPLDFGKTPWDHLTRTELLRSVQMLYAALSAEHSALQQVRALAPPIPYWSAQGVGSRAIAKGETALGTVLGDHDDEDAYRAFFRYATSLLFPTVDRPGWVICGNDHMWSPGDTTCLMCGLETRPITWDDLRPGEAPHG